MTNRTIPTLPAGSRTVADRRDRGSRVPVSSRTFSTIISPTSPQLSTLQLSNYRTNHFRSVFQPLLQNSSATTSLYFPFPHNTLVPIFECRVAHSHIRHTPVNRVPSDEYPNPSDFDSIFKIYSRTPTQHQLGWECFQEAVFATW